MLSCLCKVSRIIFQPFGIFNVNAGYDKKKKLEQFEPSHFFSSEKKSRAALNTQTTWNTSPLLDRLHRSSHFKDTLESPIQLSSEGFHLPVAAQVCQDWRKWNIGHSQPPKTHKINQFINDVCMHACIYVQTMSTHFKCLCCCSYTASDRLLWIFFHCNRWILQRGQRI